MIHSCVLFCYVIVVQHRNDEESGSLTGSLSNRFHLSDKGAGGPCVPVRVCPEGPPERPPPSPMENLLRLGTSLPGGGVMSGFCCVCHVFPPHVSRFGLFPVLVKCHYELILVQPCLSNYLWFTCVFIVLSVQLIWSGLLITFPVSLVFKPCLSYLDVL